MSPVFSGLAMECSEKFSSKEHGPFRIYGQNFGGPENSYVYVRNYEDYEFVYYDGTKKNMTVEDDLTASEEMLNSYRVVFDPKTNTIISKGDKEEQKVYDMVSSALDNPRTSWSVTLVNEKSELKKVRMQRRDDNIMYNERHQRFMNVVGIVMMLFWVFVFYS